ncbi:corticotropin-releasing factor receptor 2 isoform X3 [Phyllostomus hastatus]|uniref:corticotropin-releasing factor receptor 2 isoform X3 n=1 Tax=Phyllostomus hastatus TaxID=9423 RepID=UPI001E67F332|nr:corticotropin-releasing factor receptor 2 isoform X3 [Phyllostomus hastatus]
MGCPAAPSRLLHVPQPLLCLLCLLPPLLRAAGPGQAPRDQRPWTLPEQHCHAATTLANLSGPYSYCNTTLDQIGTCWPRSAAGALVERPCPEYFNGVKYNTTRNAYRECSGNGTWASRIDYSQCVPILDDKQRKYSLHYHIALVVNYLGHCVSVAALTVAFLLFLTLRSIRCLRNVIHWNLITTFILRNVTWFLLQLIDHEVHENNEVWCRCITVVFNYFVVTNFFWMFVEGCYLHTAIVMAYSTERLRKWLFLVIGWCIPCPITIAWALGKLYYENEQCWFGKEPGDLVDYIYQGPIILVLLFPVGTSFLKEPHALGPERAASTSCTQQVPNEGLFGLPWRRLLFISFISLLLCPVTFSGIHLCPSLSVLDVSEPEMTKAAFYPLTEKAPFRRQKPAPVSSQCGQGLSLESQLQ